MINHIRTLLLNRSAAAAGLESGVPGAEYVPAGFAPLELPDYLARVRADLGLGDASAFRANCALGYVMRMVHMPDMAPFALRFDPRVTYDFSDDAELGRRLRYVSGTSTSDLVRIRWNHQVYAAPPAGYSELAPEAYWTLRRANERSVALQYMEGLPSRIVVSLSGGRSQEIPLIPGYLSCHLETALPDLAVGFTCRVTLHSAPEFSPLDMLSRLSGMARLSDMDAVFQPWAGYEDELSALSKLWKHSPEHSVRLAAAALGCAYHCERVRSGVPLPYRDSTLRRYAV